MPAANLCLCAVIRLHNQYACKTHKIINTPAHNLAGLAGLPMRKLIEPRRVAVPVNIMSNTYAGRNFEWIGWLLFLQHQLKITINQFPGSRNWNSLFIVMFQSTAAVARHDLASKTGVLRLWLRNVTRQTANCRVR